MERQRRPNKNTWIFLARCPVDDVPFCYLDIQMCHTRLLNKELKLIEERIQRKRSTWKSKMLSYGLGLTLFNSDLISKQSFYVHDLLFFAILKEVLRKLDYLRSRFFWQGDGYKRKYRLTKWNIVCRPRDQGLGISDLEIQNKSLLSK